MLKLNFYIVYCKHLRVELIINDSKILNILVLIYRKATDALSLAFILTIENYVNKLIFNQVPYREVILCLLPILIYLFIFIPHIIMSLGLIAIKFMLQ